TNSWVTPTQALIAIQPMAGHSQKWHDETSSRNVSDISNADGLAAIARPRLKKNVLSTRKSNSWKRSSMENLSAPLLLTKDRTTKVLLFKLPPKEQNPKNFTLPCTIGQFNFYAMADLGASVNVMPMGIFEFLKLTNLRKTYMLIEVANMIKKAPLEVVENILVGRNGNGAGLGPATTLHPRTRLANHASNLPRSPMGILSGCSIGARYSPKPAPNPVGDFIEMNDSIWGQSYAKWYKGNSHDSKPRTMDYTFKEWMIVRIRYTDVNGSIKKALLKSWVIDCFEETLDPDKDPMERSFDDYKWVFDLVIEQLADEYELGIEKKSHILDMIWENCKNIQGKAKEWWYDYWFEEDEKQENRDKKYDPPMVHMETLEITKYSFNNGNSFICVTDKIKDTLSLG
nr:hypothetical protein [Tanacetum cinerariifolium]